MSKKAEWLAYALSTLSNDEQQKAEKKIDDVIKALREKGYSVEPMPLVDEWRYVVSKSRCYVALHVDTLVKAPKDHSLKFVEERMQRLENELNNKNNENIKNYKIAKN